MTDTIRLQEWTKGQLDFLMDSESHTSYDSAVKSLLKDREIVQREHVDGASRQGMEDTLADPLQAVDSLPRPSEPESGLHLIFGDVGTGKTTTLLRRLRSFSSHGSNVVIMSALGEYDTFTEEVNGQHIRIGSQIGLNPLQIKETPTEVFTDENADIDPYDSKIRDVMSFFETYFHIREFEFEERRGVLERAIQQSYQKKGITRDPATHANESPVIPDVLDVLGEMVENPEEFTRSDSESERNAFVDGASQLLVAMKPFQEGGEFENLSRRTEVNTTAAPVILFDLSELVGHDAMGMITQLLFSLVSEHKKHDKESTVLAVDGTHNLLRDVPTLSFLERFSRHTHQWDLSAWIAWSNPSRLIEHEGGPPLIEQSDSIYLHQLASLNPRSMEYLNLSVPAFSFVRTALPGTPNRGSEVLVRERGEGWMPYWEPPSVEEDDDRLNDDSESE